MGDSSVEAPKRVWVELDRALANAELITTKKQLGTYRWAAAASIFFGLIVGAIAFSNQFSLDLSDEPGKIVISERPPEEVAVNNETPTAGFGGYNILTYTPAAQEQITAMGGFRVAEERGSSYRTGGLARKGQQNSTVQYEQAISRTAVEKGYGKNTLAMVGPMQSRNYEVTTPNAEALIKERRVNKVPTYNHYIKSARRDRPQNSQSDKFWAGLDLSSGYYNPNYSQSSPNEVANVLVDKNNSDGRREAVPELSESMSGGVSYSLGLNFGMELKNNWSVESGVQYSLLGARTLTNLILESATYRRAVAFSSEISGLETISEIIEDGLTEISVDDVDLNNTFQFISIPVQAGYVILDTKLNIRFNAGLAANLYLGNKLTGTNDFTVYEIDPGRTSPYRELTFSGLAGLEFGYLVMDRVNLVFEPNYQQSLQSLTKRSSNFTTSPNGVGFQAGFKYSF